MVYLAGEWVPAAVGMAAAFVVGGIGVTGLGYWVLRGDRINREVGEEASQEPTEQPAPGHQAARETSVH